MPRYIDADLVRLGEVPYDEELSEYDRGWNDACEAIANTTPTADVVEVKYGRWYKPKEYPRDSYRYICTACQEVAYFVTGNNGKKHKEDYPGCGYKFCPNCGADMGGADNEG